jgi:hypothetical protein
MKYLIIALFSLSAFSQIRINAGTEYEFNAHQFNLETDNAKINDLIKYSDESIKDHGSMVIFVGAEKEINKNLSVTMTGYFSQGNHSYSGGTRRKDPKYKDPRNYNVQHEITNNIPGSAGEFTRFEFDYVFDTNLKQNVVVLETGAKYKINKIIEFDVAPQVRFTKQEIEMKGDQHIAALLYVNRVEETPGMTIIKPELIYFTDGNVWGDPLHETASESSTDFGVKTMGTVNVVQDNRLDFDLKIRGGANFVVGEKARPFAGFTLTKGI